MALNSLYSLLRPAAVFALCLPLLSQSDHLTVEPAQKVVGKRNAKVQAKIPVLVQPGYHVNSNAPLDEYLIPLKLTFPAGGGLAGGEVSYPKPAMEKYEFSEKPLSVYTGKFDLTVNFQVAADAPAGPGMKVGKLRYQACDNKSCYPPKTVDVTIPYSVE